MFSWQTLRPQQSNTIPHLRRYTSTLDEDVAESLRQRAIDYFAQVIPTRHDSIGFLRAFGLDRGPPIFRFVSLFRESSATLFLPWVYYSICQYTLESIMVDSGDVDHVEARARRRS